MSKLRIVITAFLIVQAIGTATATSTGALGGSAGPTGHELFDKGDGYLWVLIYNSHNDGFQCSVNFITLKETYSIHGPLDAEMAKADTGSLWFDSPAIPATPEMRKVTLAVHGSDGAFNWPALQKTMSQTDHGTLIVLVKMSSMFTQKSDADNITVSLDGNEVFKTKLVGLQAAYAKLNTCISRNI